MRPKDETTHPAVLEPEREVLRYMVADGDWYCVDDEQDRIAFLRRYDFGTKQ